jgi:hypothetical protein
MNLGNVDGRHVEEEKGNVDGRHVEEENDSSVFTVTEKLLNWCLTIPLSVYTVRYLS